MTIILTVITIGTLWGIFEATAGHFLHLLPFQIGAFIWFPAAYLFLSIAYKQTKKPGAVLLTAVIAASVKMLNIFFPVRIDFVIKPAVSILTEALAFVIVSRFFKSGFFKIFAASTLWRIFFLVAFPISGTALSEFLIFQNAANIALVFIGAKLPHRKNVFAKTIF